MYGLLLILFFVFIVGILYPRTNWYTIFKDVIFAVMRCESQVSYVYGCTVGGP